MEVQKRVVLKTFDKPKEADVKPIKLAIRFEIKLEESTDDKCPEISYTDLLLKHELKRKRHNSTSNSVLSSHDTFEPGNTENLEALAKQMEEKYGKSYGGMSRGRNVDLGDGYDTEDSFIDNEEAYDELVPSSLTTKHGGFYINTGVLDFKEVSDDEIVSDNELKPKKKKKRIVSSSESEGEKTQAKETLKRKRKKNLSASSTDSANKKALLAKKRKKMLTSTDKLDKERIKKKKIMLQKKKLVERAQLKLSEKELNCKAKQYDSLIDDVIKSQISPGGQPAASAASTEQVSAPVEPSKGREQKSEPVKLPDNLSDTCLQHIDSLKQAGGKRGEEKSKFFTNDINNQLTSLDIEVRKISSLGTRNAIYSHLSTFLPINRETLMKRMKLLRQKELVNKLHQPIEDLKSAINEVMPAQIERFNQESLARQASKLEDMERQKEDTQDSEDDAPASTQLPTTAQSAIGSTHPLPTSTTADPSAAGTQEEKKKERSAPTFRKKFEWTERVRERLCAVITIKMESYDILKTKGQTPDDHLKEFLENEIRILWPKGWMQSRVLYRESKSAHVKWTNPSTQPVASKPAVQKKPALIASAMKMATNISTKKSTQLVKNSTATKEAGAKQPALPTSTTGAEAKDGKATLAVPVVSATSKSLVKPSLPAHKSLSDVSSSTTAQFSLSASKSASGTDQFKSQKPTAVVEKKEVITLWDTPSSTNPDSKSFHSVNMKSTVSATNQNKSSTFPANQNQASDDIQLITLPDSITPSKALALTLPSNSPELNLGTVSNRKQNISTAQSEQAATAMVLQKAQALHQKHMAASLAGQQAMLQHKKMADTLATQQKVAKQQHIAAIAAEQKANASRATQQRIAQQALASKHKLSQMQQQKLLQSAQQQEQPKLTQAQQQKLVQAQQQKMVQEQQKVAQAHKLKLALAQQQKAQQHKIVQAAAAQQQQRVQTKQKIVQEQPKLTAAQQQKLAQAQQQMQQMQMAQQQRTQFQHQQARQQMTNQQLAQSPTPPTRYSGHGSTTPTIVVPQRLSPSASSTARGTTSTIASSTSRQSLGSYSYAMPGSTAQTPVSPTAAGASPSWPITGLQPQQMNQHQQQQHQAQIAADYRRYLTKREDK